MPPPERREGFGFAWWSICRSSNCGGTARSIPDACTIRLERDLHDCPSLARVYAHVQASAVPVKVHQALAHAVEVAFAAARRKPIRSSRASSPERVLLA